MQEDPLVGLRDLQELADRFGIPAGEVAQCNHRLLHAGQLLDLRLDQLAGLALQEVTVMFASPSSESYRTFELTPLSGSGGARIEGIDLSAPIPVDIEEEIRRAFLDHSVLVFSGQDLSPEAQITFTRIFGEVVRHPLYRSAVIPSYEEILVIEHKAGEHFNGKNDIWHSDLTFEQAPALGSVLHCKACWEGFGDTMFANQYLAYESLSTDLRRMLDGLEAEHSAGLLVQRNNELDHTVQIGKPPPAVRHPVVRTHPETGRKALYFHITKARGIVGMDTEKVRPFLEGLLEQAVRPENSLRHKWRSGDVLMFDNRCTMHRADPEYDMSEERLLWRIILRGDRPA